MSFHSLGNDKTSTYRKCVSIDYVCLKECYRPPTSAASHWKKPSHDSLPVYVTTKYFCLFSLLVFSFLFPLVSVFLYNILYEIKVMSTFADAVSLHSKCLILKSHLILQIDEFQSIVIQLSFHLAFRYTGEGMD